jgi:hypothetical protein
MILFLIPVIVRGLGMEDFYFDEEPRKIGYNLVVLVTTGVLIIAFRLIFGIGIRL